MNVEQQWNVGYQGNTEKKLTENYAPAAASSTQIAYTKLPFYFLYFVHINLCPNLNCP
jgi:hypothetical protein